MWKERVDSKREDGGRKGDGKSKLRMGTRERGMGKWKREVSLEIIKTGKKECVWFPLLYTLYSVHLIKY